MSPAGAHNGPPFPIIMDRKIGSCIISVWAHPDVGIGTFYVMVDPPPGGTVPKDLKVEMGIQPVSRRLSEVLYTAHLEPLHGQVQYKAEVTLDAQELWRVRVLLETSHGRGEALATVEATPPGLGRWDLLWYVSPFAAVGFLWFRSMARKRSQVQSGSHR
jgi:hypothetical protein